MSDYDLTRQERAYFGAAKSISILSDHKQKLGCVVVDTHKVISSGHNSQTKYHRLQAELDKKYFKTNNCDGPVHAEFSALLPLMNKGYNLKNATLYVYREHKDGTLGMARPCPRCMEIIKRCGIRKIKYTTDAGYAFEKIQY